MKEIIKPQTDFEEKKERGEAVDDMLEEALSDISPDKSEFINRRINHINFARTIFWLCVKSRKEDFFYARELSQFIKLSIGRVHHILNEFVENKFLRKRFPTDNLIEFWFIKEKDIPIIQEYLEKAQKTLGIKFKYAIEQET